MPATVTLATTTLTFSIDSRADEVVLSSVSGVSSGLRLVIGRECMKVYSVDPTTLRVKVGRGVDGTGASRHTSLSTVWIASPEQLYTHDPYGDPGPVIRVSPWINLLNGKKFYAQGDALPDGGGVRYWQEMTTVANPASLGVLGTVSSPTSST